jgi:hypothetical protein
MFKRQTWQEFELRKASWETMPMLLRKLMSAPKICPPIRRPE